MLPDRSDSEAYREEIDTAQPKQTEKGGSQTRVKKKVPGGKRCLCEGTQEEDDKRFENVKKNKCDKFDV